MSDGRCRFSPSRMWVPFSLTFSSTRNTLSIYLTPIVNNLILTQAHRQRNTADEPKRGCADYDLRCWLSVSAREKTLTRLSRKAGACLYCLLLKRLKRLPRQEAAKLLLDFAHGWASRLELFFDHFFLPWPRFPLSRVLFVVGSLEARREPGVVGVRCIPSIAHGGIIR
jgi:hypothetical protein